MKYFNISGIIREIRLTYQSIMSISEGRRRRTVAIILNRVKRIAAKELDVEEDQVVPDASFWNDLDGDDAIHWKRFILMIEEEFELHIHPQDEERIVTVQDMVEYLKRRGVEDEEG